MDEIESKVRETAENLQTAIDEAVAAGYIIALPRVGRPVKDIIISHGGKVADLAEPLDLTNKERANLPEISTSEDDHVMDFGSLRGAPVKTDEPPETV